MSLDVTGVWTELSEQEFLEQTRSGVFIHFRDRGGATELDPLTGADTGKTAREIIAEQAAAHGWPLVGLYVSGSGGLTPHFALHRSQFPPQAGAEAQRAGRLQDDLDAAFERVYRSSVEGRFWIKTHVWQYRADGLYAPRVAQAGDFAFYLSTTNPPASWWQGR